MFTSISRRSAAAIATTIVLSVACGKDQKADSTSAAPAAPAPAPAASAPGTNAIVVELYSDAQGNYFKPAEVHARKGDVVRFVLKSGVHNVDFLPDSNPGKAGLPKASEMLQLPDQTLDVTVNFASGKYYFQCDPHAALGMKGHLIVDN